MLRIIKRAWVLGLTGAGIFIAHTVLDSLCPNHGLISHMSPAISIIVTALLGLTVYQVQLCMTASNQREIHRSLMLAEVEQTILMLDNQRPFEVLSEDSIYVKYQLFSPEVVREAISSGLFDSNINQGLLAMLKGYNLHNSAIDILYSSLASGNRNIPTIVSNLNEIREGILENAKKMHKELTK